MIPFSDKVQQLLKERNISIGQFEKDTGIYRQFFYRMKNHRHHKATVWAISGYLCVPFGDLVDGTNLEHEWE
jgi:hypothetical protein